MAAARKKAKAKTKSKAKRGSRKKAARKTQSKRKSASIKRPKRDTRATAPLKEMDAAWQSLLETALERHRAGGSTAGSKSARKK